MPARYKLTVAPEALVEVVKITQWWRENRQAAPKLFQNELDDALVLIASNPALGRRARSRRVGNARVVTLQRSGYLVFYQVLPLSHEVSVVHIRHGKRRSLRMR